MISPDRVRERVVVGIDDSDGAPSTVLGHPRAPGGTPSSTSSTCTATTSGRAAPCSVTRCTLHDQQLLLAKELLERTVPPMTNTSNLHAANVHTLALAGDPAKVLVEMAKGADLLVVGSRGRGGFVGLLLGSVSRYCTMHAPCPVCVIPARS